MQNLQANDIEQLENTSAAAAFAFSDASARGVCIGTVTATTVCTVTW